MIGNDPKTIDYFKQQRHELYNYVLNDVIFVFSNCCAIT